MIYVTGDIHANPERLGMDALAQRGIHVNPEDYVIVCGDFGIPWVGESDKTDHKWLEWLAQLPYEDIINTILAIQQTYKMFQRVFTKAHYPAIFTKGPDGIHVTFPDLPGCITWGRDVPQAIEAARTALTLHLSGMRQDKQSLPPAIPVSLCKEREQAKDDEAIYIIYES